MVTLFKIVGSGLRKQQKIQIGSLFMGHLVYEPCAPLALKNNKIQAVN